MAARCWTQVCSSEGLTNLLSRLGLLLDVVALHAHRIRIGAASQALPTKMFDVDPHFGLFVDDAAAWLPPPVDV